MRVLLTGSSGRLGRRLAPMLRAASHAVIGLDSVPGPDARLVGSIVDRAMLDRAFVEHRGRGRADARRDWADRALVSRCPALFAARSWRLLGTLSRVYDPADAERVPGSPYRADSAAMLDGPRTGGPLPFG